MSNREFQILTRYCFAKAIHALGLDVDLSGSEPHLSPAPLTRRDAPFRPKGVMNRSSSCSSHRFALPFGKRERTLRKARSISAGAGAAVFPTGALLLTGEPSRRQYLSAIFAASRRARSRSLGLAVIGQEPLLF
jgi:hypothetical protein